MPSTAKSYRTITQLKCRCSVSYRWCGPGEKLNVLGVRVGCSVANAATVAILQLALALGGRVGEPVVTRHWPRHDVGRHLDVVHQKERSSQHVASGLDPAHPQDRNVGQLSKPADRFGWWSSPGDTSGTPARPRRPAPPATSFCWIDRPSCCHRAVRCFRRRAGGVPRRSTVSGAAPPGNTLNNSAISPPAEWSRRGSRARSQVDGSNCQFVVQAPPWLRQMRAIWVAL